MFQTRNTIHNETHATAQLHCFFLIFCVNLGPKAVISRGEQDRYGCRQRTLLTVRLIKLYGGLRLYGL